MCSSDLEVGTDRLTDGVDELMLGLKAGETLENIGRGPGGVPMTWKFTIHEVSEQVLPELTDEWVEANTEYATVAALREGLSEEITKRKIVEAQMSRRDATLQALGDLLDESLRPSLDPRFRGRGVLVEGDPDPGLPEPGLARVAERPLDDRRACPVVPKEPVVVIVALDRGRLARRVDLPDEVPDRFFLDSPDRFKHRPFLGRDAAIPGAHRGTV